MVNGSETAGARTQDLRIKSPLLYQLSYGLKPYTKSDLQQNWMGMIVLRQHPSHTKNADAETSAVVHLTSKETSAAAAKNNKKILPSKPYTTIP